MITSDELLIKLCESCEHTLIRRSLLINNLLLLQNYKTFLFSLTVLSVPLQVLLLLSDALYNGEYSKTRTSVQATIIRHTWR